MHQAGQAAVDLARRHGATAAVAAALVPLAAAPAAALFTQPPPATFANSSQGNYSGSGGGFGSGGRVAVYEYDFFTNTNSNLTSIVIPEVNAGDLNFNFNWNGTGLSFGLPSGWTATEVTSVRGAAASIKNGTAAAAFVVLTGSAGSGSFLTFYGVAPTLSTLNANFALGFDGTNGGYDGYYLMDPPIPNTPAAAVPEPGSAAAMVAGLLALAGARRRKRG